MYLLRAFRRGFRGGSEPSIPSRFLMDIPQELITAPVQKPAPKTRRASPGWSSDSSRISSIRAIPTGGTSRRVDKPDTSVERIVRGHKNPERPKQAATSHFSTGDKVRHGTFGEGIVMDSKISGGDFEVTVAFKDGAGVKRLLLGFAPLEKVE